MERNLSLEPLNNVSEVDVVYKRKVTCRMFERPQVLEAKDAYNVFVHYWNEGKMDLQEEFKVLLLNRAARVRQLLPVSQSGMTGTVADPRLILAAAVKVGAVSLVLAHNHPSGSLKPSRADEELTQKLKHAAAYFDIKVLNHLIITSEGYYSFTEEELL